jgi:tripartite-type tricarboxylate transporter receptor subunit TctC
MMKYSKGVARMLASMLLAVSSAAFAAEDAYPSKPIRWITPYPPGGSTTKLSRLIGQKLSEHWGQNVIIDNRPGGDTIIGTEVAAHSEPDGYTVLLAGNTAIVVGLTHKTPYDLFKDFTPVTIIAKTNYILVVNPTLPVANLKEFIAYGKARPGKLNVASVASGSAQHLMGELFGILAGVKMQHIPYKGGAAGIIDLIGGRVQASFSNSINVIPFIKDGKLKGLAVTGEERIPTVPEVPTYAEAGLPSYHPKNWQGIIAPAGTPKEIVAKLASEVRKIVAMPDILKTLDDAGMNPYATTPAQMAEEMRAARAEYVKVIETAKLRFDG